MTPPRPTNETPSAGAVAKSLTEIEVPGDRCESYLCEHWLTEATLALDTFAREREAAVVREAHPYLRHQDTCGYWSNPNAMSDYKCTCGLVQFRTRAAEARRLG